MASNGILSNASWDRVTNTTGFSTGDGPAASTPSLPSSLQTPQTNVATYGGHAATYYVTFILNNGTPLTLNGDQYFEITDFSAEALQTLNIGSQSAGAGAGKVTFDPLQFNFTQGNLAPTLLKMMAAGIAFKEVDVLGYSNPAANLDDASHLVDQYSFGRAAVSDLTIAGDTDDGTTNSVSLGYGSEAISFYRQNSDGSFASSPTVTGEWDSIHNVAGFSTNGSADTMPTAGPATLSPTASNVAATGTPTLDYYVRFTKSDGTVITVNDGTLFKLSDFSFEGTQTLNIGSQSGGAGAGKVTFDPLQLTFTQPVLNPTLLQMLAAGMAFNQVDVLGYSTGSGTTQPHIVEDYNFGLVAASDLVTNQDGSTKLKLEYGSEAITKYGQNTSGQNAVQSSSSWDRVTNTTGFSTGDGPAASTPSLPSSLQTPQTNVATYGGHAATYYVTFILNNGTPLTLNGDQYFEITDFSAEALQTLNIGSQSAGAGAGKVTFDPLQFNFTQGNLAPTLLKMMAAGIAFKEVDVLGYSNPAANLDDASHLVDQYSFGRAAVSDLTIAGDTDDGTTNSVSLGYGSEAISFYRQNSDGSFASSPTVTGEWDSIHNVAGFSTNGSADTMPTAGPATLSPTASNVAAAGTPTLDYYVRFTKSDGTVITVNDGTLFKLSDFSFEGTQTLNIGSQSGGAGAGKVTFDPLQLTFTQPVLNPTLLQMLAAGMAFNQVDVLGYSTGSGTTQPHIVEDYNFGLVAASDLVTNQDGSTKLKLEYGSEAITKYGQNTSGQNAVQSSSSWDRVTNTTGFSTGDGPAASTPSLPSSLQTPQTNVATYGGHAATYYVTFILNNGTPLTLNGDQYFEITDFSAEALQTLNIGSQSAGAGAGKVTFDPLQFNFTQGNLAPTLLKMMAAGIAFKEVDVLGYSNPAANLDDASHLVDQYSFGRAAVSDLTIAGDTDDGTTNSVSLGYGSEAISFYRQNSDGSFASSPTVTGEWDSIHNVAGFSTNGSADTMPTAGPATLSPTASNVAAAGTPTLDYYVRFTKSDGTVITVNDGTLFKLSDFSFEGTQTLNIGSQSGGAGAGKVTFDPLQLTFTQPVLNPTLLQMLAAGMAFNQVDVLGYSTGSGTTQPHIVEDYNFGLVAASDLVTNQDGSTKLKLEYGSEAITQYGSVACYCAGTAILTERGERPVEDLVIGDRLVTASGAIRPIKWIGRRAYNGRFAAHNPDIWPIRFKASALADNVPKRDLLISPDHAMFIDGFLVPARDLVNDASIVRIERPETIAYFHVELESHDIIVAEGALSETFIDDDSRGLFHNAAAFYSLYPDEWSKPSRYCAPRIESGFGLEEIRQRLSARAMLLRDSFTFMAA